ncbi:hypothetical protein GCM10022419_104820 [Nonomuraea rosea]|uniref:Uncharacterized protein n=1 Tax=Nonomuraea rosea TaxID=638574 RepID=A0ABP6ZBH2_9ACTN
MTPLPSYSGGMKGGVMSAQPVHGGAADHPRVPRTIGGISDALRGSRRAQFFAELLEAQQGPELDGVLMAWWGRAMLDTDPERDRVRSAAEAGSLPTTTMEEISRRRQERGAQ